MSFMPNGSSEYFADMLRAEAEENLKSGGLRGDEYLDVLHHLASVQMLLSRQDVTNRAGLS